MLRTRQNIFFRIIFITTLFFFGFQNTFASGGVTLESSSKTMAPGSEFSVSVLLSAPEKINAFDFELSFPEENLKFLDFNNAGSVVDFWQSQPTITEGGKIRFSGGILGGFTGSNGFVVKIYFQALSTGNSQINLTKKSLYLADGKGTETDPTGDSLQITIADKAEEVTLVAEATELKKDITPPELVATIIKNPDDGKRLIVFNAKDLESGIDKNEMRYRAWLSFSDWQEVENPVLAPRSAWTVEMRSVNGAGLETVQTLKNIGALSGRLALFLLVLLVIFALVRYNYSKQKI